MWVGVWCWQIVKDTLLDCSQHWYIVILMFSRSKISFAYCRPNAFQFKGFVKKEETIAANSMKLLKNKFWTEDLKIWIGVQNNAPCGNPT